MGHNKEKSSSRSNLLLFDMRDPGVVTSGNASSPCAWHYKGGIYDTALFNTNT
jgi:hypothetical protein